MPPEVIIRKIRSALLLLSRKLRTRSFRVGAWLQGTDVTFGKQVEIGRLVTMRTTDGGKIHIGDHVHIDDFAVLGAQRGTIRIGSDTYVGVGTHVVSMKSVTIGKGGLIAAYCVIRDMNHGTEPGLPINQQQQVADSVSIGDDVWLGTHVVVTAGTTIGDGAIIGANAVVTKDIADRMIAVGLPARPVRHR